VNKKRRKNLNTVFGNPNINGTKNEKPGRVNTLEFSMPLESIDKSEKIINGVIRLINLTISVFDSLVKNMLCERTCVFPVN